MKVIGKGREREAGREGGERGREGGKKKAPGLKNKNLIMGIKAMRVEPLWDL